MLNFNRVVRLYLYYMKICSTFLFLCLFNSLITAQTPLISANTSWKYLDNGTNQGTAWRQTNFNDNGWASGNAELGYGDGDETTVVSFGPNSSSKYTTTYFRKTFNVANSGAFSILNLQAVRDDGIVVYINGTEVWRDNMPSGNISSSTFASSTIAFGAESAWNTVNISPLVLNTGTNVIAVEIHQDSGNSSDISFNLKLDGVTTPQSLVMDRGPYLNIGTSSSMIVKWRTTTASDSKVFYGTSVTSLTNVVNDAAFTTNHEVKITGLNPSTIYYYSVGASNSTLSVPSSSVYFKTSPVTGTKANYKFWVVGDAGTGNSNQANARNGFLNYTNNSHIDGWLWLGDNAYDGGFDSEYQTNVFSPNGYINEMKRIVTWPAPGNHDYNNNIPFSPAPAYFNIFALPAAAEAGGVASNTEAYYSFNYGNVHFISIDSYNQGRNNNDPMATWIAADLAANTLPWVIAYWHHPPYTKGSHNSDNSNFLDGELVDMRQNILPILENGGVDLVLNGHSHCYERSYLLDGHYGNSGSLQASMKKDAGSGSYPNACPYQKQTTVSKANKGAVYTVCGCSGKLSGTSSGWPHPAMYYSTNTTLGSMLLEFNDNRLDAKFITANGTIGDKFTIVKNAGKKYTYTICPNQSTTLTASWPENVQWFPLGVTQNSVVVNPAVSTVYYAYDALTCIKDTFQINMLPPANCAITAIDKVEEEASSVYVYPTVLKDNNYKINISYLPETEINSVEIYNALGKKINCELSQTGNNLKEVSIPNSLSNGTYAILINLSNRKRISKKIIIQN